MRALKVRQRPIKFPPRKSDSDLIKEFLALRRRGNLRYTLYTSAAYQDLLWPKRGVLARARVCACAAYLGSGLVYACVCIYVHVCGRACVWRTTRETDDRAPLTPEPHTRGWFGSSRMAMACRGMINARHHHRPTARRRSLYTRAPAATPVA